MNLYTKLLCYLGLIKAPTLDIVQWIKDNPQKVYHGGNSNYEFHYKGKGFICYERRTYVEGNPDVFNQTESYYIYRTCSGVCYKKRQVEESFRHKQALQIRKELLE